MTTELAGLIAKKFIARRDVKAQQNSRGFYMPVIDHEERRLPWKLADIEDHIAGRQTFGHYLVGQDNNCKIFAFDIDLNKNVVDPKTNEILWTGGSPESPHYGDRASYSGKILRFDPRRAWLDRAHPARAWMKYQFKMVAHVLCSSIEKELDIPCAVTYSGAKGIHVYGFTGLVPAADAREGAQIVLDSLAERPLGMAVEAFKGKHFFKFKNDDPVEGYPNLSIEVFPKQDTLDGKDLGNLMRLPLGRNLKSTDPTFFVDMTSPLTDLSPVDPMHALTARSAFEWPGE